MYGALLQAIALFALTDAPAPLANPLSFAYQRANAIKAAGTDEGPLECRDGTFSANSCADATIAAMNRAAADKTLGNQFRAEVTPAIGFAIGAVMPLKGAVYRHLSDGQKFVYGVTPTLGVGGTLRVSQAIGFDGLDYWEKLLRNCKNAKDCIALKKENIPDAPTAHIFSMEVQGALIAAFPKVANFDNESDLSTSVGGGIDVVLYWRWDFFPATAKTTDDKASGVFRFGLGLDFIATDMKITPHNTSKPTIEFPAMLVMLGLRVAGTF
jgi:hypothetical protein